MKRLCLISALNPPRIFAGMALGMLAAAPTLAQTLTPEQINDFRNTIGNRVEAGTILGGDYGLSGGNFSAINNNSGNTTINVTKFGGMGNIYPIKPLGDLGIGWQPQLQGSMGYLTAKKDYNAETPLKGDQNENKTFAIQFGGGARFWFDDHFSIATTLMGMYGHTENDYTANSAFGKANESAAEQIGLINWSVDTWTIRPATDLQYKYTWHRTIITLSSDFTYYYTESFQSSSSYVGVNGNSESWENKLDIDVPLGVELWGHELRTGGFFSRSQFYNGLREGLNTDYLNQVHGRLVLDFLGQLWKVQYIGIGVSYLWANDFNGWSIGADIAFRF